MYVIIFYKGYILTQNKQHKTTFTAWNSFDILLFLSHLSHFMSLLHILNKTEWKQPTSLDTCCVELKVFHCTVL